MDAPALASAIGVFAGVFVAGLGWRLSARVQQTAIKRQGLIDKGQQIEERAVFEKELRVWLRGEIDARSQECEQEKTAMGKVITYWRGRALGTISPDDTPPPELWGR